jgi:hypothetical protein
MKLALDSPSFVILVDYDVPLERLIAAGEFAHVHRDITAERFSTAGSGRKTLKIEFVRITGDEYIATPEILDWMQSQLFRPTSAIELLTLPVALPHVQLRRTAHVLGSIYRDEHDVSHVIGCKLWGQHVLRCAKIEWEPWWFEINAIFPCVRL